MATMGRVFVVEVESSMSTSSSGVRATLGARVAGGAAAAGDGAGGGRTVMIGFGSFVAARFGSGVGDSEKTVSVIVWLWRSQCPVAYGADLSVRVEARDVGLLTRRQRVADGLDLLLGALAEHEAPADAARSRRRASPCPTGAPLSFAIAVGDATRRR